MCEVGRNALRPTNSLAFCFVGANSVAYSSAIDLEILQKKCLEFVRIEALKKVLERDTLQHL